jgi:hypothetical protein
MTYTILGNTPPLYTTHCLTTMTDPSLDLEPRRGGFFIMTKPTRRDSRGGDDDNEGKERQRGQMCPVCFFLPFLILTIINHHVTQVINNAVTATVTYH